MSKLNFVDACIEGYALYDDIDNYIDEWHDGDYKGEIYEFLGMTQVEYRLWVENDRFLKYIIKSHIDSSDIKDVLYKEFYGADKLAARAKTKEEAIGIYKWLKRMGKIEE